MPRIVRGVMAALLALLPCAALAAGSECAMLRQQFKSDSANPHARYAMARCAAREANADQAFHYLEAAAARGFRETEHMRRDPDLRPLQADPRWDAALARVEVEAQRYAGLVNRELYELYRADQADRRSPGVDWQAVAPRDEARRQRVAELAASGALRHSDDYYHAALIYQHGSSSEHFHSAHVWALRAVELEAQHNAARWLACASEDRWLHATGKPQVWGTQFRNAGKGTQWTMDPFDADAKNDAERTAMNVPSLAESRARLADMNVRAAARR